VPKFFREIIGIDSLRVFGAFAYASRCVRRILPLEPEFSRISSGSSLFDAVHFAERCALGMRGSGDALSEVAQSLEDKRALDDGKLRHLEAIYSAGATLAAACVGIPHFKRNQPGGSEHLRTTREILRQTVAHADRAVSEWVIGNSLPNAGLALQLGYGETAEYYFEHACNTDIETLLRLSNLVKWPSWGRAIDATDDGPLGDLWPQGEPKDWPTRTQLLEGSGVSLLLNALVLPYSSSNDGSIIKAIAPPFLEILKRIEHDPNFLFEFTRHPRKFEEFIAAAYDRAGYDEVTLTPRRNDGGRDVIADKKGFGSVRILEQTKAYAEKRRVTHDEVRAMLGVLSLDSNASKGIITTTADFQPGIIRNPEISRFMPHRLELKNGNQLRDFLLSLKAPVWPELRKRADT
jgi:restriction system protein